VERLDAASSICASTDLLSQPRAIPAFSHFADLTELSVQDGLGLKDGFSQFQQMSDVDGPGPLSFSLVPSPAHFHR
jgi:hypothetical protein